MPGSSLLSCPPDSLWQPTVCSFTTHQAAYLTVGADLDASPRIVELRSRDVASRVPAGHYGPYWHYADSFADAEQISRSGVLWGRAPFFNPNRPMVQAYARPFLGAAHAVKFWTPVAPTDSTPTWVGWELGGRGVRSRDRGRKAEIPIVAILEGEA